jgi:hypothetical protein
LSDTHAEEFFGPPVFIENIISILSEFFHVRSDEHLSELDEVTMLLIIHFNDTPWVCSSTNFEAIRGVHNLVRAHNSKWYFAGNLFSLRNGLLIFIVIGGCLEDVDIVVSDVR